MLSYQRRLNNAHLIHNPDIALIVTQYDPNNYIILTTTIIYIKLTYNNVQFMRNPDTAYTTRINISFALTLTKIKPMLS